MKRRDLGLGAVAGLAVLALAGMVPAAAADIQRGGTLNVIVDLEPASLDPLFGNALGSDRRWFNLFAENLIFQDEKGEFQPWLAESWQWSDDKKSITFKLRRDVKFQDGTAFDAQAAKFNFDRVIDPVVDARARQYMGNLESTEIIDDYTIKLNLKEPSGAFMATLAIEPGSMMSPTAIKERGADFARSPVGTGPFKVMSWTSGEVQAERFDGYWRDGADGKKLPYLDKVRVRALSNTAVKLVELKSGSVQLGDSIQVKDFDQVQRDSNLVLLDTNQGQTQYVSFNNAKPPFDNIELRKAVAMGINREAIEKAISRGEGVVLKGLEPPSAWAYDPDVRTHKFDPAAAKEAYLKSGHKGPLTMSVIQRDPDTQIAQLMQAMLKQIGIELKIEVLERQAWVEKTLGLNYELGILRATLPRPDPDMDFSSYYGRNAGQNYSGLSDPKIWDMVDQARTATDQAERKKIYTEIQQQLLDNYNQTYLFWRPAKEVARKELQNLSREFASAWRYGDMWLAQ